MSDLTVVKLGGSLLDDSSQRCRAIQAIADRWHAGEPLVVVHGGGKNIDAALTRLGIPKKVHHGLRVTDAATLQVVIEVLAGSVNKTIVSELASHRIAAVGVCGADGATLAADLHPDIDGVSLGFVGRIAAADPRLIQTILRAGFLPVVASVAIGGNGELLNVNADAAAAAIAASLGARRLVFLTDVEGLLDPRGTLVREIGKTKAEELLGAEHVSGGMKPKLRACVDAVNGGVPVVLISGPATHASSLLEGKGGTHVVAA